MTERWNRPDGTSGMGRATVERIDDNTFRLTVIDNGADEYRGLVRVYRRLGPAQTVGLQPRGQLTAKAAPVARSGPAAITR